MNIAVQEVIDAYRPGQRKDERVDPFSFYEEAGLPTKSEQDVIRKRLEARGVKDPLHALGNQPQEQLVYVEFFVPQSLYGARRELNRPAIDEIGRRLEYYEPPASLPPVPSTVPVIRVHLYAPHSTACQLKDILEGRVDREQAAYFYYLVKGEEFPVKKKKTRAEARKERIERAQSLRAMKAHI